MELIVDVDVEGLCGSKKTKQIGRWNLGLTRDSVFKLVKTESILLDTA